MQVSYGCEDNYGAFNGNFRVSSSDVNRDVKKVSVKANPPCSWLPRTTFTALHSTPRLVVVGW